MTQVITNVDTGARYYFSASTPYEAMTQLRYYLGDKKLTINKTESNSFLYLIHKGETYATRL